MSKQIYKAKAGRDIEVLSLFDANTYSIKDLGPTRDGDDTQSRSTARAALLKTRVVAGKDVRVFMLRSPPVVLHEGDKFDRDILKDHKGNWLAPDAEWLAMRDTFIGRRNAAAADAKAVMAVKSAHNLIANLRTLADNDPNVASAAKAALEAPPAESKPKKAGGA